MLDKEPQQFEVLQRIMGYLMVALLVVVYYFTSPNTNYQILFPIFVFVVLLFTPKISHVIQYKYGSRARRNGFFLIDVVVPSSGKGFAFGCMSGIPGGTI